MNEEWDEEKRLANWRKHRLDFVDATLIFDSWFLHDVDDLDDYGELRLIAIGVVEGEIVTLEYTQPDDDTIRLISFRHASPAERRRYEASLAHGLGRGSIHER